MSEKHYDLNKRYLSVQELENIEECYDMKRAKRLLNDLLTELAAKRAFSNQSGFGEQLIYREGFMAGYLASKTINHCEDED